ncbi:hypothetical protein GRI38_13790 [Altererythrobacter aurantiacus]|uniref:Uncharacterized protein n=1 Tax=Parapontixanthobacter aurantiacus TaxID=1463599 RepID=A0A844ZJB2_9SPHN|nr:hypothetical protein [Parapontixanthobacter aurantiacus]MXO87100.1 hypothetical protein [Parapontixanthobacter aurantiacus]
MRKIILGFALASMSVPALSWEATSDDDNCSLSTWAGWTKVYVSQDEEGVDRDQVYITFFDTNWSIAEGDLIEPIRVESYGGEWFEAQPFAHKNAFTLIADYKTMRRMFEADSSPSEWEITKGGELVTRIYLGDDSYFAWESFNRCRANWVIAPERLMRNWPPKDPFAK